MPIDTSTTDSPICSAELPVGSGMSPILPHGVEDGSKLQENRCNWQDNKGVTFQMIFHFRIRLNVI